MKNIKIRHLQLFARVCEAGSYSRVCAELGLSQPSLSRIIKDLEETSGLQLFDRTGRGVKLSPAGEVFLEHVLEVLKRFEGLELAVKNLQGGQIGEINVSIPLRCGSLILQPLLKAFKRQFAEASLHVYENLNVDAHGKLRANEVDVALLYAPPSPAGLTTEFLASEELYAIGSDALFKQAGDEIDMGDLAELPILIQSNAAHFRSLIEAAFAKRGLTLKIAQELETMDAQISFAADGQGIAILPYSNVWREVEAGRVCVKKIVNPTIERRLAIATNSSKAMVKETARLLKEQCQQKAGLARWLPISEEKET